jgi:hypothetical protein
MPANPRKVARGRLLRLGGAAAGKSLLALNAGWFCTAAGKSLAMIFTKPSMRTRVSFETVGRAGDISCPSVCRACLLLARAVAS